ncbi:hypothetical protein BDV19DRAFT_367723 [Aspergillus venezuelensis]
MLLCKDQSFHDRLLGRQKCNWRAKQRPRLLERHARIRLAWPLPLSDRKVRISDTICELEESICPVSFQAGLFHGILRW